jgi:predicted flap endonuclease-1-like 5' DNA nuclease
MFGLDPFDRLVAVSEIALLLLLAALIGWWLGRLLLVDRIRALRSAIATKEGELEKCRQSRMPAQDVIPVKSAVRETTSTVRTESSSGLEPAQPFIVADPLLPAYAQDDTPTPITVDALPAGSPFTDLPTGPVGPNNSETAVLDRIAARAGEVNFDRIGRATATEADDLKDIVGIGPFLERKLHSLGIYTFRQIANFTREDMSKVNEIIEFFPGRIERDSWVEQAKTFHERKYGTT